MWVFIHDELWASYGQPPLYEECGRFVAVGSGTVFGLVSDPDETRVLNLALYNYRHPAQPDLFSVQTEAGPRLEAPLDGQEPML